MQSLQLMMLHWSTGSTVSVYVRTVGYGTIMIDDLIRMRWTRSYLTTCISYSTLHQS